MPSPKKSKPGLPPKPATHDPLAGVRVSAPAGSDEPPPKSAPSSADTEPPAPSEPEPSLPDPPPAQPPPKKPPEPAPKPVRYKITALARRSMRGQMVTLRPGKIVSDHSHGAGIREWLQANSVPFEELKD